MTVDVPQLPSFYKDRVISKSNLGKARTIHDARVIAEDRQIGNSAKKSPDDVDNWDRLTSKHKGLRRRTGYDKPLNEEGFPEWMIVICGLFDGDPETRCMRQREDIDICRVYWLPVKQKLERAMQDRFHQDSGNASALANLMQLAAHPCYMQEEKADSR